MVFWENQVSSARFGREPEQELAAPANKLLSCALARVGRQFERTAGLCFATYKVHAKTAAVGMSRRDDGKSLCCARPGTDIHVSAPVWLIIRWENLSPLVCKLLNRHRTKSPLPKAA